MVEIQLSQRSKPRISAWSTVKMPKRAGLRFYLVVATMTIRSDIPLNASWLKCVLSLINTNTSIPALKTLPGKVSPHPFLTQGLGSRLSESTLLK